MITISAKEAVIAAVDGVEVFAVKREALTDIRAFDLDTIANGDLVFFTEKEESEGQKALHTNPILSDCIPTLYKSGKSMEEISEILDMSLADVSRVIDRLGLGKEKYKGKRIPDKGSAPIKGCIVGR